MTSASSVELVSSLTEADAADLSDLIGQLSASSCFDRERFEASVRHPATAVMVARVGGRIVGMATLVIVPLPTGVRGHVEDVVVSESQRSRGIGRMLLLEMIDRASQHGVGTLDLTSRAGRESAIRLYESVGFVRRETNVMRLVVPQPEATRRLS